MFKKITISLLLAILFVGFMPNMSYAQKTYHQAISANPLGLIFGVFNATYEQQVTPKNSFTVYGSYFTYNEWTAGSLGGSYRFYLMQDKDRAIRGFSFGPTAQVAFWSWGGSSYYTYDGGTIFYIGAEAAYKWIFDDFVVEPTFNLRFPLSNITGLSGFGNYGFGCNLGYAW